MPKPNKQLKSRDGPSGLFDRVVVILEQARSHVVRSVNHYMVLAYWQIGREIIQEQQEGKTRADYGKRIIDGLSESLTVRYGRGFSIANLKNMRQFYLCYKERSPEIGYPTGSQLAASEQDQKSAQAISSSKSYPLGSQSSQGFHPDLGWSHYRALMRIESNQARAFYEIEAIRNGWKKRDLERQIHSLLFERLAKSRDKEGLLKLANEGQQIESPIDVIKDPYVLEFLNIPEAHQLAESSLEEALITHLQDFLLELGSGFAFVGRQKRLTLEGDHFYPDLVFYHIKLQCYVVIDLKVTKLTHQDLGQMLMYVHYYDRDVRGTQDNPTIGLLLCTDKNEAVVRYVLDEDNQQIFASRYKLELPDETQLATEIKRELDLIREQEEEL